MLKIIYRLSSVVLLSLCYTVYTVTAQPTLKVTASGTYQIDADIIELAIQLNSEAATVDQAYQSNQQLQQKLIQLISRYGVKKKFIQLQPLSINPYTPPNRNRNIIGDEETADKMYRVRQRISLTLEDRQKYVDLQLALIKNGFDEFRGTFGSTKTSEAKDQALQNAIQNAKNKTRLISQETGVELKALKSIEYHENEMSVSPPRSFESVMRSGDALVTEFDQYITVTAHVTMIYFITDE